MPTMVVTGAVVDKLYYFWVSASNDFGEGVLSNPDSGYMASLPATTHALTISKSGTGTGTVTGGGIYPEGTEQAITATADLGSTFTGWSGNGDCFDGLVTINEDKSCIATFTLNVTNTYTLSISKSGTGTGTVSGVGNNINCGAVCSEDYETATVVTLIAIPNAGSNFIGWIGANCAVRGECIVTIDREQQIFATFERQFPWTIFLPVITRQPNEM